MLFLSSLQSDPGMAFVDEAFLSNPQGTMKAHLKAWFKNGRTKPPGLGICAILNRPSESTDLFFCQTNNRFHFCCYLGDNYASAFSPIFFLPLSISRSLSRFPTFVVLCECKVNCLGVLWIILVSQECLRLGGLQLRGKTEMSSLIFCRKWLVLYVSDLKWTLLFGIYQTFKHPMLIYLPHYSF